ncbi:carboxypeptidase-like regulatory domain-containing protein [Maioricimonas sp. JC845]|uniref:carboxypeptidase-like regulatory domain-containing protein n=1 Tax=Maioricimonas sp. JC845 TaxID=3232138 RepID=UPI00345B3ADA
MLKNDCRCIAVLIAVVIASCGCGGPGEGLATVTGTITLDGEPLPNALVEFASTDGGSIAYGRTDKNGEYRMMFSRTQQGASIGKNIVRITTADVSSEDGREVVIPERVPATYNRNSSLTQVVESGDNICNFDLVSAEDVEQPNLADQ